MNQLIKNTIIKTLLSNRPPIIVNSYGRSGSTILYNSIALSSVGSGGFIKQNLAKIVSTPAWDLDNVILKGRMIYKTHDYPPMMLFNKQVKFIYVFSNPVDATLSLLKLQNNKIWNPETVASHSKHLRSICFDFNECIDNDKLNIEKHLLTWLNETRFPIAFIRYDELWNRVDELSDFLGFTLKLPEYKERTATESPDLGIIKRLETTYSSLIKTVNSLESFFINNNNGQQVY